MNMKTPAVLFLLGFSLSVLSQNETNSNSTSNSNEKKPLFASSGPGGIATDCNATIKQIESLPAQEQGTAKNEDGYKACKGLVLHSELRGLGLMSEQEFTATANGEIQCKLKGGFTTDYIYCQKAVQAFNIVVNAEKALMLQQQIRTDLKQRSIQQKASQRMALGDTQTSMFDASIEDNKHKKSMMQEQAIAYSAAVSALGNAYFKWPSEEALKNECLEKFKDKEKQQHCVSAINLRGAEIVANSEQKIGLVALITEYIGKGTAAGIAMGNFNTAAQQMEQVKQAVTSDDTDPMVMQRCVLNPTDPLCAKPGSRVSGEGYKPGNLSFGDGTGNNSFNMGEDSNDFGIDGDPSTVGENPSVTSADSPFEEIAKEANGILDPAAAASMQPGGGGPGGGGGAGGGLGGGGASLGSDLAGAENEDNKEANIKTSKASGNYNFAGGGGFSALKKGKEDSNPFASMFDNKASGGIEEDRSIASGDIDGKASGLFEKISKRYGQIQADKRIEAKNLE